MDDSNYNPTGLLLILWVVAMVVGLVYQRAKNWLYKEDK